MKNRWLLALMFLFLCVSGLFAQFPKYLYGIASWYGEEYRGKKTASGELFNPDALTAAHRTLPFGTQVEVENLENGKKVIVKINDRGPFVESRILDLSKAAADQLGFLKKGTGYVKVVILRLGENNVDDNNDNVESTEKARKENVHSSSANSSKISSSSSSKSSKSAQTNTVQPTESISSSSEAPSTDSISPTQTNVIHVVLEKTNVIYVTNVVVETISNGSYPYHDRIIERGIPEKVDPNLMVDLKDHFVDEEPILNDESTVVDVMENSNTRVISTPKEYDQPKSTTNNILDDSVKSDRGIIISAPVTNRIVNFDEPIDTNNSKFDDLIGFLTDESEVTPNLLLSNDTALKVEEMQLHNELSNELQESLTQTNTSVTSKTDDKINTNDRIDFSDNANDIEIDIPQDILSNQDSIANNSDIVTITNTVLLTNFVTTQIQTTNSHTTVTEPVVGLNYAVQVGAFRKEGNALGLYDFLRGKGLDVFTTEVFIHEKRYIRVRLGYYTSLEKAKGVLRKVQDLHLPGMIVKIQVKD